MKMPRACSRNVTNWADYIDALRNGDITPEELPKIGLAKELEHDDALDPTGRTPFAERPK